MTPPLAIDPDLEFNYNNLARRPDAADLMQHWSQLSAAYRRNADAVIDCVYGDNERERLDAFRCGQRDAPLLVYIHGGYWQRGEKSIYSHIAEVFNNNGVDVAIIGYPLCPEVSMSALLSSIRKALVWLFHNASKLGVSAERINLSGHSAGGHLTALGMTTRWTEFGSGVPADLLKSAIPISGLYQLQPLLQTSISEALHLSDDEVAELSPALLPVAQPAPLLVVVGGAETPEFFRQAENLIENWSGNGFNIDQHIESAADHFDVVSRLASADSELFKRVSHWLQ